ncbi:unnamed protein product, partial [Mesorhabditis belari]|uniref:Uncharacterized protein n=1 Tax=Mesorhabditis belari TaxID=2138241 RepID=A0AAF3EHN6_9BILA
MSRWYENKDHVKDEWASEKAETAYACNGLTEARRCRDETPFIDQCNWARKTRNEEPSPSAEQPVQRPLIELEDLQAFAAKGKCNEIDEANFNEAINKAIDEAKYNKACRLIVAYLLKVIKKSQTTSKGAFDAEQMAQIGKIITGNECLHVQSALLGSIDDEKFPECEARIICCDDYTIGNVNPNYIHFSCKHFLPIVWENAFGLTSRTVNNSSR